MPVIEKTLNQTLLGDLSDKDFKDMMRHGTFAAAWLKRVIPTWFPDLGLIPTAQFTYTTYLDKEEKGYVLRVTSGGGLKFMPSYQLGYQRNFDRMEAAKEASGKILIACQVRYPKVRIKFEDAEDMLNTYPLATLTAAQTEKYFADSLESLIDAEMAV